MAQRRHLITAPKLDAMRQIAAVHMFGRTIEFPYRSRHAAREANPYVQRDQFNDSEENTNREQDVAEKKVVVSQGGEQCRIEHGGPGAHVDEPRLFFFSILPVDYSEEGGKVQGYVKPMGTRRHLSRLHRRLAPWQAGVLIVSFAVRRKQGHCAEPRCRR